MMFKSLLVSASVLALAAASAEQKPAEKPTSKPSEPAPAVEKDPTEGMDGGKLDSYFGGLDEKTPGPVLAAITAGCDRIKPEHVHKIPQFIDHINAKCFASVLKHEEKSAWAMLRKVTTPEKAEEVSKRLAEPLATIPEERLAQESTLLAMKMKEQKKAGAASDKKADGSSATAVKLSAGLLAVAGLVMLI